MRLDNVYDPAHGYAVGTRERYFARNFPTDRDIQAYLSDSTFLRSSLASGNSIDYFDNDHGILYWHENQVKVGGWSASPILEFITLGDQWRIAIVYSYCYWFSGEEPIELVDRCTKVENPDWIIQYGHGTRREIRKGNVFNLAGDKPAPFRLPRSDITIDFLLATISPSQQN